jgi:hypothetical protein
MNRGGDARRKVSIPQGLTASSLHVKMTQKKSAYRRNICLALFVYTSAAGIQAVAGWTEISE